MKERPIIFNSEMVRAILDGRKTQTRRVMKPAPMVDDDDGHMLPAEAWRVSSDGEWMPLICLDTSRGLGIPGDLIRCPYGVPGDRLWIRETWAGDDLYGCVYRADHPTADIRAGELDEGEQELRRWSPSIFMPRWASRITLEVTEVRAQRVQEISDDDAIAEGAVELCTHPGTVLPGACEHCMNTGYTGPRVDQFRDLWDSINDKRGFGWDVNPWVWAVTFKVAL